jgi:chromosome partitioning protein
MNINKVISVVNQKGGVGKTTTAVNLSTALAAIEKKVLLIDLDPQGNLSTGLGFSSKDRKVTVYDLIMDEDFSIEDTIVKTQIPRLHIISSSINLSGIEFELATEKEKNIKLYNKINNLSDEYDYIIIDCPPSLGILTVNALAASNSVIVPLQCEFYALEGLAQLLRTIESIKNNLNANLHLEGVILTMYDSRNRLSEDVISDAREHLGDRVFKTIIPRNVKLSEAPSHGLPAILYDRKCSGSLAYIKLAKEFVSRQNINK